MVIVFKDISVPVVLFFESVSHYRVFALLLVNYPITFDDNFPSLIIQYHFLFKNYSATRFRLTWKRGIRKARIFFKNPFRFFAHFYITNSTNGIFSYILFMIRICVTVSIVINRRGCMRHFV